VYGKQVEASPATVASIQISLEWNQSSARPVEHQLQGADPQASASGTNEIEAVPDAHSGSGE